MRADLSPDGTVNYRMVLGEQEVELNSLIGQESYLDSLVVISTVCIVAEKSKKVIHKAIAYPCMQKLAQCDMCIMKPETCHFEQGTCRDPAMG